MKPIRYKILGYLQIFVGMGAIAGSLPMLLTPEGDTIGMPVELLANSPFTNYFIPGILLLLINGAGQLISAWYSLKFLKLAGVLGIVFGAALMVWIMVQMYYLGFGSWLQPMYLALGTIEFFLALGIFRKQQI